MNTLTLTPDAAQTGSGASDACDQLARRAQAGDRAAFNELVERLGGQLIRVGARITGDLQEGQDVAQEALVRGFRALPAWDGRGRFSSWLCAIAARCAIDRRRRRQPELQVVSQAGAPASSDERAAETGLLSRQLDAERRQQVRAALESLTEPQRVTVELRHFEGMSLKEIAAVRGCALGTVKATLFQAFKRLRPLLQGLESAAESTSGGEL